MIYQGHKCTRLIRVLLIDSIVRSAVYKLHAMLPPCLSHKRHSTQAQVRCQRRIIPRDTFSRKLLVNRKDEYGPELFVLHHLLSEFGPNWQQVTSLGPWPAVQKCVVTSFHQNSV